MNKLTFKDMLDASVANLQAGSLLTITDIGLGLLMTLICMLMIYYTYIHTFQGVLYQRSYNMALILASLVTTLVIMTISGNLALTLGMVGALSIVRFRTAVKDPLDVVFMFWAIAIGIANGVAFFKVSLFGTLMLAIVMLGLSRFRMERAPYLLIIKYSGTLDDKVKKIIQENTRGYRLKTKTRKNDITEVTAEVRLPRNGGSLLDAMGQQEQVLETALLAYSNEIADIAA